MPEAGGPPSYHHGDLRNALVKLALRTIETRGLEALSLRGAARALGVSPGAVYRHFEDKAALVAVVVNDGVARLVRAMETAARSAEERAPSDPDRAAFVAMGMAYVRFAGAHPAHFRAMFAEGEAAARGPHELLWRALDRWLGPGRSVAERRAARRAALAAVHGLAILIAGGPPAQREPPACDAAAREVLDVLLRGLSSVEPAGGQRGST